MRVRDEETRFATRRVATTCTIKYMGSSPAPENEVSSRSSITYPVSLADLFCIAYQRLVFSPAAR